MKKELIHFVEWKKITEEKVEHTLAELRDWGVKNIVAHPVWFRDGSEHYVEKMAERLTRFGLKSTACHALWGDGNDCIIPDSGEWAEMIRKHGHFLRELTALGVTTYTIHLGWYADRTAAWNFNLLRKTLDALLPICEETSITLALENSAEPFDAIVQLAEMVKQYHHDFLGMCYDCGHANCYQKSVVKTLEVMRNDIVTCHLHDNYGEHDDHNPPSGGNIDWPELTRLLDTLPRLHHGETESGEWDRTSWEKFCHYTA